MTLGFRVDSVRVLQRAYRGFEVWGFRLGQGFEVRSVSMGVATSSSARLGRLWHNLGFMT